MLIKKVCRPNRRTFFVLLRFEYGQSDEFAPCVYEERSYSPYGVFPPVLSCSQQSFAVCLYHVLLCDAIRQHAGDIVERAHDLHKRHGESYFSSGRLFVSQYRRFCDAIRIDIPFEVECLSFSCFHGHLLCLFILSRVRQPSPLRPQ